VTAIGTMSARIAEAGDDEGVVDAADGGAGGKGVATGSRGGGVADDGDSGPMVRAVQLLRRGPEAKARPRTGTEV
jgi:hypothetical protein